MRLNRALDASFINLVPCTRIQFKAPYLNPALRKLALLRELGELVLTFRSGRTDAYGRIFRNLLRSAQGRGIIVARELSDATGFTKHVDVPIPFEATVAAAQQARGYLMRHGRRFVETSAETVA